MTLDPNQIKGLSPGHALAMLFAKETPILRVTNSDIDQSVDLSFHFNLPRVLATELLNLMRNDDSWNGLAEILWHGIEHKPQDMKRVREALELQHAFRLIAKHLKLEEQP